MSAETCPACEGSGEQIFGGHDVLDEPMGLPCSYCHGMGTVERIMSADRVKLSEELERDFDAVSGILYRYDDLTPIPDFTLAAYQGLARIRAALEEAQARIKGLEEKEVMAWNAAVEASERDY